MAILLSDPLLEAMRDPELVAEAQKGRMDMDPSAGEELQTLVKVDQPRDVIDRVKKILTE
jgi:hypothetical protein